MSSTNGDSPRRPTVSGPSPKRYSVPRTTTCLRCRTARVRCSHERPACERCRAQNLLCEYGPRPEVRRTDANRRKARVSRDSAPINSPTPVAGSVVDMKHHVSRVNDALGTKEHLEAHLNAFFTRVYPLPGMSFIRRASLSRRITEKQVSQILVKAICGIAARFLPGANTQHAEGGLEAQTWMQSVKYDIITETEKFSTDRLAALLCLVYHQFNSGHSGGAWLLVALAARFAFALGINAESSAPHMPWVERETRRRLMWSTYFADCFCSTGCTHYMTIRLDAVSINLPSDEASYQMGHSSEWPSLAELVDIPEACQPEHNRALLESSLFLRWIWLMSIRADLQHYVHFPSNDTGPRPWEHDSTFGRLIRRLAFWRKTLPSHLDFNVDNLYVREGSNELDSFATIHLCFESVHSVLYRVFLRDFGSPDALPFLVQAPPAWLESVQLAAYVRAKCVKDKFETLITTFPNHVYASRMYNIFVLTSIQAHVQYIALVAGRGEPVDELQLEAAASFRVMISIVEKLVDHFAGNRRVLRDMVNMLRTHGFNVEIQDPSRLIDSFKDTPTGIIGFLNGYPHIPDEGSSPDSSLRPYLGEDSMHYEYTTDKGLPDTMDPISTAYSAPPPRAAWNGGDTVKAVSTPNNLLPRDGYPQLPQNEIDTYYAGLNTEIFPSLELFGMLCDEPKGYDDAAEGSMGTSELDMVNIFGL